VAAALLTITACRGSQATQEAQPFARVSTITSLDHAIGGPSASARVGDFLLENDQIRAVIEQGGTSFLPSSVGGALVDVDLQRPEQIFRGGNGLDQLGQITPIANLSVASTSLPPQVRITNSPQGAEVTAATDAGPILRTLLALSILIDQRFASSATMTMYNEYDVRPGERLVRITTTVGFDVPLCPVTPADGCNAECDDALYDKDCHCPTIPARCQPGVTFFTPAPLPDRPSASLLDVILGDLPDPLVTCAADTDCDQAAGESCVSVTTTTGGALSVCRKPDSKDAGIFLGDLLVFGGNLTPFARGIGYDTETDIRRLFDQIKDTIAHPLNVDGIFATGDRVSLGYVSPDGNMLVPIFRGPFSLGATHSATCPTNGQECLEHKLIRIERWVSVGNGDVASAQAPLLAAAGKPTGVVSGSVRDAVDGHALTGVRVFALRDPRGLTCDATCQASCPAIPSDTKTWTLDQVRDMNRCRTKERQHPDGTSAVETFANTDPGTDPIHDGRFDMTLPVGDYVLVAVDGVRARSQLATVSVTAGSTGDVDLETPAEAATLHYAIFDGTGELVPGKITIGHLADGACKADGDCASGAMCQAGMCAPLWQTLLPLELGGKRPVDGILYSEASLGGEGSIDLPPGDYDVVFSHGPSFTIDRQRVTLRAREYVSVEGTVTRVVDHRGWIAADLHVHSNNSIDAPTHMDDRVKSFLVEDMDFLTATDHDWIAQYDPLLQQMGVSNELNTMVGLEMTTQEYGHYLAFPLRHQLWANGKRLQANNAVQWRGLPPQGIIDAARALGTDGMPVLIDIPHPYDYFDYYRVDPVTLEPTNSLLAFINPIVDPSLFTGDFEAMELVNTKNFNRIRRLTVSEIRDYDQAYDALIAQFDAGTIDTATYGRRWLDLSMESLKRQLHRTVAEQEAALAGEGGDIACLCGSDSFCSVGEVCDQSTMTCAPAPGSGNAPPPADALCRTSRGVIDDWFNMLNRGVFRTGVGGGDAHLREAGFMRTYLRTDGVTPPFVQPADVVDAVRKGRAIVSNGPMVHFRVDDAQVGDTLKVSPGTPVTLHIEVEKAPWYDVDRIEVYRNGHLIHWGNGCSDTSRGNHDADPDPDPCVKMGEDVVVAWDVALTDTPDRDAWYVVLVYGLDGRNMAPVYESEVLAEIGTPEITARLFTIIPGLREFRYPPKPAIYPVLPFAFTNPIWVDVGGDGWQPPSSPPSWCQPGDSGC
jgi:hypothetical protein